MKRPAFSIAQKDPEMLNLIAQTNQKILAEWAIDCATRVLPFFEEKYPQDPRPKRALKTLQEWIDTGKFSMKIIRKASLDSHASARNDGTDTPAKSAARACGQAVATAHVPRHAYGSAIYAQQAIFRSTGSIKKTFEERNWQYRHLQSLS